ncbi:hypothetical protein ACFQZC_01720 [Streptacidiphilus monticola]
MYAAIATARTKKKPVTVRVDDHDRCPTNRHMTNTMTSRANSRPNTDNALLISEADMAGP